MWKPVLYLSLLVLFCGGVKSECTKVVQSVQEEGLQNLSGSFSWLGVFKVQLFAMKPEVKTTGVILITKSFALINAEDVVKLPYEVFQQNTTVMFYKPKIIPWYVKPLEYFIHPEYKTKTFSTIALLKLDVDDLKPNTVLPVCWFQNDTPKRPIDLWVTGYIPLEQNLERFMISAHLQNETECQGESKRSEAIVMERDPVHYLCLDPQRLTCICEWQNGVALISNESKFYTLVGFGLQNPGCNSTPHFIDLDHYYLWAAQFLQETYSRQRKLKYKSTVSPPWSRRPIYYGINSTLVSPSTVFSTSTALSERTSYEVSTEISGVINTSWMYSFVHLDTPANDSILISTNSHIKFKGGCGNRIVKYNTNLIHLQYGPQSMAAIYKFTLHDLLNKRCTYIKMRIIGLNTTDYKMNYCEVVDMGSQEKNPDEDSKFDDDQVELDHLYTKPAVESNVKHTKIKVYELYLALNYDSAADLVVELYGIKKKHALVLDTTMIKEIKHHDISILRFEWKSVHLLSQTNVEEGNRENVRNEIQIINESETVTPDEIFSTDAIFTYEGISSMPTVASTVLSGCSNTPPIPLNLLLGFSCVLQKII